jgi:hypothetical protein
MNKFKQDLKFGENKEILIKPLLENKFNCTLTKTKNYCKVDFIDDDKKIIFELKGRKCSKNRYPDTMIGYNKVLYCLDKIKEGYTVYFIFSFTDNNCYYEFTNTNHNISWKGRRGREDRGRPEYNQYYNIPISELIDF